MGEVEEYVEFLRKRGRRASTLYRNQICLRKMIGLLREAGRPWRAADITEDEILWLREELSDNSECVVRSNLRMLSNFAEHFTGIDIEKKTALLYNDDVGTKTVVYITKEDYARLYEAADAHDRMILILGAYMGLRRAEIVSIRMSDIKDDIMLIRGKGHGPKGKLSYMQIPERVKAEMKAYLEFKASRPCGFKGEHLIETSERGQMMAGILPVSAGMRMRALSKRTGIPFTTHSLRRLYATTLYYDVEADLVTIKNLMRHTKVETTLSHYIAPMQLKEHQASSNLEGVLDAYL